MRELDLLDFIEFWIPNLIKVVLCIVLLPLVFIHWGLIPPALKNRKVYFRYLGAYEVSSWFIPLAKLWGGKYNE